MRIRGVTVWPLAYAREIAQYLALKKKTWPWSYYPITIHPNETSALLLTVGVTFEQKDPDQE